MEILDNGINLQELPKNCLTYYKIVANSGTYQQVIKSVIYAFCYIIYVCVYPIFTLRIIKLWQTS